MSFTPLRELTEPTTHASRRHAYCVFKLLNPLCIALCEEEEEDCEHLLCECYVHYIYIVLLFIYAC